MRPQGADGELRGVATLEADWYKEGRQRLHGYRGRRGGRGGLRPNKQKAYYGQGGQQGQEIKDRRDRAVYDRQTFLMSFAKEDMSDVFT